MKNSFKLRLLLVIVTFVVVISGCKSNGLMAAPDFSVPLLDLTKSGDSVRGEKVSLSSYKGKPLVLNFWAPWCPPCKAEAPVLERVYKKYQSKIAFLAIAIRDSDQNIEHFVKSNNLTFQIGIDPDAESTSKYGVNGLPETFFIDANGNIKRSFVGAIEEAKLSQYIEDIL